MLIKKLKRPWAALTAIVLLSCSTLIASCSPKVVYQIPKMGEEAIPNLQLEERPRIDLTDEEIVKPHQGMPVVTGKILKNQAAWDAYAEIAEGAVKGYRDYLKRIFSPKEK